MSDKTYTLMSTQDWSASEVKELQAMTAQPSWALLKKFLRLDIVDTGAQSLDVSCETAEHERLKGRASAMRDILCMDDLLKAKVSEIVAEEK